MDPARCHAALPRLASPLNSLPLCCTAASTTFHTDVWLEGSSDIVPALLYPQFPLHTPPPSSVFKNFQQRGFDNPSRNLFHGFTVPVPTVSIFFPHVRYSFLQINHFFKSLKMDSVQLLSFSGFLQDYYYQTSLKDI